jgi:coenzyme F420-reducing hydrogenase beta subunit
MKIEMKKTVSAASCPAGIGVTEYRAGQTYEVFDSLAETFIREKWGEKIVEEIVDLTLSKKAISDAPENKAIQSTPEKKKKKISKKG